MNEFEHITGVIVKAASNDCNLDCVYCYEQNCRSNKNNFLPIDLAKKMINETLLQLESEKVEFVWHGGEPLLQEIDYYAELIEYQNLIKPENIEISNALQTNAILIDENWCNFLKKNNIQISTTIDGPAFLHDANRVFPNGEGTHAIVVDKINMALDSGIQVNTISVITDTSAMHAKEIYNHLKELNIKHCSFLPCYVVNDNNNPIPPTIEPGLFGQFLCELFDIYSEDISYPKVREFEQIFKYALKLGVNVCNYNGSCHKFICIDWDGCVYSCDTSPSSKEYQFGSIKDNSLYKTLLSPLRKEAIKRTLDVQDSCRICKYWEGCHGGCPNQRQDGKYYFCKDRKIIYAHTYKNIIEQI